MDARDPHERDPHEWVDQPVRRALDGVLYRWLALFGAPVAVAVVHKLTGDGPLDRLVHLGLPAFLVTYIAVHLVGRFWRRRGAPDGWGRAVATDRGTVVVTRSVGWVAVVGCLLAFLAPLGSLHEPREFLMEALLWFAMLFPLYALAVWCTIDCANHRLGRAVEESQRRFAEYWRGVAAGGRREASG